MGEQKVVTLKKGFKLRLPKCRCEMTVTNGILLISQPIPYRKLCTESSVLKKFKSSELRTELTAQYFWTELNWTWTIGLVVSVLGSCISSELNFGIATRVTPAHHYFQQASEYDPFATFPLYYHMLSSLTPFMFMLLSV